MAAFMIPSQKIHAVVFDFDGTLAKLNIDFNQMRQSVEKLIFSYGIVKDDLHEDYILEMIDSAASALKNRLPAQADIFHLEARALIEKIETEAARNGELFEDTKSLLQSLRAQDIACGIITRNCARAVKIVFPDILSYCPVVVCRDDVKNVKPHPDHLSLALSKLRCSAEAALMIGDHPLDIKTGRNAGTFTCGVLTGRCQRKDFIEAGADLVLAQASDILSVI